MAVVAQAHRVKVDPVFHWRKLYREGRLDIPAAQLAPVRIQQAVSAPPRDGVIRIKLGRARRTLTLFRKRSFAQRIKHSHKG